MNCYLCKVDELKPSAAYLLALLDGHERTQSYGYDLKSKLDLIESEICEYHKTMYEAMKPEMS